MKQSLWSITFCFILAISFPSFCCGQDDPQQDKLNNGSPPSSQPDYKAPEKAKQEFNLKADQSASRVPSAKSAALKLLFANRTVQNDIELSREQLVELRQIEDAMNKEIRPLRDRLRKSALASRNDGRDDDHNIENSADIKGILEELDRKQARYHDRMADVLLPFQMKWLDQAVTQYRLRKTTPKDQSELLSEYLAGKLGLTSEQLKEMQEISNRSKKDLEEIIARHREQMHNDLLEVLSQEQRDTYRDIFGKKIDF